MFLQFQHEWLNFSFDVRHLTSGTCDVPLGLEITPSCRLWLKKFLVLRLPIDRDVGGHGHLDDHGDGNNDGFGHTKYYTRIVVLHGQ